MNDFVGVPFKDGGRDFDGCDCWGLVKLIYKEKLDVELPDFDISAFDMKGIIAQMQESKSGPEWEVVEGKPKKYDVVALHIGGKHFGFVNHVGVYVGSGKFIHTLANTASMVNRVNDPQWIPRILGVYRWVS